MEKTIKLQGTMPPQCTSSLESLFNAGYSPAEIVKEGVRLFILKKKSEGVIK